MSHEEMLLDLKGGVRSAEATTALAQIKAVELLEEISKKLDAIIATQKETDDSVGAMTCAVGSGVGGHIDILW